MFSYWHRIVLALSVSVSQLLIAPPAASAQVPATDTTAPTPAPSDTTARAAVRQPGCGGRHRIPPGTRYHGYQLPARIASRIACGRRPSAPARAGSVRARSDSVPAAPVDSVLSAACGGPPARPPSPETCLSWSLHRKPGRPNARPRQRAWMASWWGRPSRVPTTCKYRREARNTCSGRPPISWSS